MNKHQGALYGKFQGHTMHRKNNLRQKVTLAKKSKKLRGRHVFKTLRNDQNLGTFWFKCVLKNILCTLRTYWKHSKVSTNCSLSNKTNKKVSWQLECDVQLQTWLTCVFFEGGLMIYNRIIDLKNNDRWTFWSVRIAKNDQNSTQKIFSGAPSIALYNAHWITCIQ